MNFVVKALTLPLLPFVPTMSFADWNGGYAGLTVGNVDAEIDFELAERFTFSDAVAVGGFGGALVQRGAIVFGGEIALNSANDAEIEDGEVLKTFTDLKGRIGYDLGQALVYGVAGYTLAGYDENGEDFDGAGLNYGVGVDYKFSDQMFAGAEYLVRRINGDYPNDPAEFDLDLDTFSVRVGFNI